MKSANRIPVPERQRRCDKTMRAAMTEPERKLWRAVRQRIPMRHFHFRSRFLIGPYADFCCLAQRLVVEVDGNHHGTDEAQLYDERRTQLIGFRVLRFSSEDVTRELASVLDTIAAALERTQNHG